MFHPGMHGAVAGQHAAQQQAALERRRRYEEEEIMTGYRPDYLAGDWQFKIVKGTFKTARQVQTVQEEMAAWCWVLVEVFAQNRIRFKRPATEAARDAEREGDPFRTVSRSSGPGCAATALLLCVVIVVCWLA